MFSVCYYVKNIGLPTVYFRLFQLVSTIKRKDIEMKKVIAALFVFCVFFPLSANATYRLKLFSVQS